MMLFVHQEWLMGAQRSIQNKFYDYDSASSEIVIVAIDEKSLQADKLGAFTKWKREYYAQAIEKLNEAGAATIGIDVTFPDPSIHGPGDDVMLRNELNKHDNVVLATRYYFENGNQKSEWPNDTLMESFPKTGWINVHLDEDGFVRTIPLFDTLDGKTVEAFSLQISRIYSHANYGDYQITDNQFRFSDDVMIPTMTYHDSKSGQDTHLMYINYFAEPNRFTRISFSDVLEGNMKDKAGDPVDFRDKIVLIGPTAIDLQDHYLSPVGKGVRMSGVEVHANNIQTITEKEFLKDQSTQTLWIIIFTFVISNIFAFYFLKVRYTVPLLALEIAGLVISGVIIYEFRIFMNVIYPIMAVLLSFIGTYIVKFMLEEKEKKFIQLAFGRYVNKDVVEQIIKDPKMLQLGGEKREITVLFSDIKNFTNLSEGMEPGALVAFLNEYLTDMTDIILKNQGTLDKYVGDAIMGLWNAPLLQPDHALNACITALNSKKRLEELRDKWKKEGKPEVYVRIGINTGESVVGNMGSNKRFDYTAMGDNVNLASRLEGVNKQYGTNIIVSESTFKDVGSRLACRELDLIKVKGRNEPVRIYELLDTSGPPEQRAYVKKMVDSFNEALGLYRENKFEEAQRRFEKIHDDAPSIVFARRCKEFLKNPPEEGWGGVWVFTSK